MPYGDGITFWPLRGMVLGAATIHQDDTPEQAQEKILACVRDRDVADRLASAVGLSSTAFTVQDISVGGAALPADARVRIAGRRALRRHPLGRAAFLDLMENLLDSIEGAPVLMLGTSRHDLLESRPTWSDRPRARRLVLQPLDDAAVAQVIHNLLGAAGLPDAFVKKVVDAAEGNPLYVEQMLSMLIDSGVVKQEDGKWVAAKTEGDISIPPTIQALLEARLDKLERGERAAAEPASVIGMEFQRPAVQSIAPAAVKDVIDDKLQALSRKHFIRPSVGTRGRVALSVRPPHGARDRLQRPAEARARDDARRSSSSGPTSTNAGSDRGREFEEILGYHLEQAYKYLGELGPIDEAGAAIGRDGARAWRPPARRALARGDMHAASSLFRRAATLLPVEDSQRLELLPDLAEALTGLGKFSEARAILREARELSERTGNARVACSSTVIGIVVRLYSREADGEVEDPLALVERIRPVLEREEAHNELANAWRLVLTVHAVAGRYSEASAAAQHALKYAHLAGNDRVAARVAMTLGSITLFGPMPVVDAIGQCEQAIQQGLSERVVEASLLCTLASLRAMNGELQVARSLYQRGRDMLTDLGGGVRVAATGIHMGLIELHGGDLAAAEDQLRRDVEALDC